MRFLINKIKELFIFLHLINESINDLSKDMNK